MKRFPVNKSSSVRQFRKRTTRTKFPNVAAVQRGGIRL